MFMFRARVLLLVTFLLYLCLFCIILRDKDHFSLMNLPDKQQNVTILMWTEFYHKKSLGDELLKQAPIPKWCHMTFDKKYLNKSQAVVFHVPGDELNMEDIPPMRRNEQIWVLFSLESPAYMWSNMTSWNKLEFNRTMTYRLDSDFPIPYGFVRKRKTKEKAIPNYVNLRTKSNLAAWMVSNCPVQSRRGDLVKILQNYMKIDVYGSCGNLYCDPKNELGCYEMLGKKYKFYLAFENSFCTDYITEKFSNALYANMVPVVYGGGDYTKLVPLKAFIDVRDFANPKILANYLKYLDQNQTEYEKYFEWKRYYDLFIRQGYNGFRLMCHAIRNGELMRKFHYENIQNWWDQDQCASGQQWHN